MESKRLIGVSTIRVSLPSKTDILGVRYKCFSHLQILMNQLTGNHGLYDKYGDKAWADQANQQHSNHGKHDSYGNSYNNAGANHGSGYYSRDRGYGYEKHYAYDKEVASKQHSDNHNSYGANHGLHDYYGNSGSNAHANHGHDRYGQLSRYGKYIFLRGKPSIHINLHLLLT